MAGFDTVDPAYACVMPASHHNRSPTHHDPAEFSNRQRTSARRLDWDLPHPNEFLHMQAGIAGKFPCADP